MGKKLLIFFLLFSTLQAVASADITPFCKSKTDNASTENINNTKIKNIIVKVDNYRKWTRNSLNILILPQPIVLYILCLLVNKN